MPELLSNIGQEQYNRLATEYLEEVGSKDSEQYYRFFSFVQKQTEVTLKDKFSQLGIKMVRDEEAAKKFPKHPAMRFKLFFREDPLKMNLISKHLNLSSILQEIRLVDPNMSSVVADVKIVVPEYLNAKIEEVTNSVIEKFKLMLRQRIDNLQVPEPLKQLINVEIHATTNNASIGNN